MGIHSIKAVQKIPVSLQQAWDFYSNPANLQTITPATMGFTIISQQIENLYAGQLIEYRIKPLLGIPLYWMTEIAEVKEKEWFVDIQRKGPYNSWCHRHYFKEIPGGTEMTDLVDYSNPLWVLGDLANALFIKRKLYRLFEYRYRKSEELFGKWEGQQLTIEIQ